MFINNSYHGYTGLINLGNTCYMNSVLQVLSNNIEMTRYYIGFQTEKKTQTRNLFKNYQILITEMWKGNNIIRPVSFKNSVNALLKKYNNTDQHDAHEFLLDMFNILHENSWFKKTIKIPKHSSFLYVNALKEWDSVLENKESFITTEFYGQYIIKYKCSICSHKFYKYDVFSCLYLDTIVRKKEYSIGDLLNHHFSTDYITFECEKCGSTAEHKVSKKMFKIPRTLIFVLKKYTANSSVVLKQIENINIEEHVISLNDDPVHYDLESIISNNGTTIHSGHYYSVIKRNQRYTVYDDHKITHFEMPMKMSPDVYMLFYSQKKN